ncbi:MAG TPA: ABC transporter permease subunit [Candidatus Poseidoniales archaeon]|nr:ABC transporter permease subunit [Candidatus Poseidoniales archaeon]
MLSDKYSSGNKHGRSFTIAGCSLLLAFILLLFTPGLTSEEERDTGWDQVSISTDNDLNDVLALNSTSAFAIGENGKIYHTVNSGVNWLEQDSGVIQDLNAIEFNGQAIVAGDSGTVLINDVDSWIDNSIEGAGNLYDLSVPHFESLADSVIFVSGTGGEIWKWSNNTWDDLSNFTGTTNDIYAVDFVNEDEGFAVGADGLIIATIDGGLSWEIRDSPEEFRDFSFYDVIIFGYKGPNDDEASPVSVLIVGENGTVIQSSGTGPTAIGYIWKVPSENSHPTNTTSTLKSISGSSRFKFWIVGDDNFVALTEDGGSSFYNQSQLQNAGSDFTGVSFWDGDSGFAVGEEGTALYTDREGQDPRVLDTAISYDTFWKFAKYAFPFLKEGMYNTLKIIVLAIFMGFTIGVTLAVFKTSQLNIAAIFETVTTFFRIPLSLPKADGIWKFVNFNPLKFFATIYTDIFRNTPLLVQFFFIYFGLVEIGIDLTFEGPFNYINSINFGLFYLEPLERAYGSAVVALGLNSGAYQTEIIRSGIQAIPTGQMEAGRSIGLTYIQSMRYVVLPQAIRIVIPPLGNETVNLVLNSALASAIGFGEITRKGRFLISVTFETFWTWGLVLMFYFAITYTLANILKYVEKRLIIPGLGIEGEE